MGVPLCFSQADRAATLLHAEKEEKESMMDGAQALKASAYK